MKHWKTTDVGPTSVTKGTHRAVKGAANQFLREKNGRLPLNLAKHSRLSLLKLIKELNHELSVANNWVQHHQNHCDDLIKENAALREALNNAISLLRRWNKNDVNDDVVIETRKALYAARKEAQP